MRMINAAKSLYEISSRGSMYIPLSIPSKPLPRCLHLERDSQWHTSALLSMALESVTLPSRLRADHGKRGLLDDMLPPLNANGHQRIAMLSCSLPDTAISESNGTMPSPANLDQRVPRSNTNGELQVEDNLQQANARFDMNLSCGESRSTASGSAHDRAREHVFGRIECLRSQKEPYWEITGEDEDEKDSRKRRRLAGVPIIERSVPFRCLLCSSMQTWNFDATFLL